MRLSEGRQKMDNVVPAKELAQRRAEKERKEKGLNFLPKAKADLVMGAIDNIRRATDATLLLKRRLHDVALLLPHKGAKEIPRENPSSLSRQIIQTAQNFGKQYSTIMHIWRRKPEYQRTYADACEWGPEKVSSLFFNNPNTWHTSPAYYLALYDYLVRQNILPPLPSQALPQIP